MDNLPEGVRQSDIDYAQGERYDQYRQYLATCRVDGIASLSYDEWILDPDEWESDGMISNEELKRRASQAYADAESANRRCCRWAEEALYWRDKSEKWQKIAEDAIEAADGLREQMERYLEGER
jgi:hypothetical protein